MPRTILLLAGLGAALVIGGLAAAVRTNATPSSNQTAWVEQHVQDVSAGQVYRLDGCLTVTAPGVEFVSLRVAWYAQEGGYGSSVKLDEISADPWRIGPEQCLSLTEAEAPCAARSARYGVVAKGDTDAVSVNSSTLQFSLEAGATPVPCPTPTPTPTPSPSPTATPQTQPTAAPTPFTTPPPPLPPPAAEAATEPTFFPSLVNGGFEEVREDSTPYGWRKIGGEMSTTEALHAEGGRSAALISRTESTKWLYQTVSVNGGSYYRLRAKALKNDSGVREALLRVSWYESADGSGTQISTADSEALVKDSPTFVSLDTGPVQAPTDARSAKVRLLLRPASTEGAVVYFDDVWFESAAASPTQGAASEDELPSPSGVTEDRPGSQVVGTPPGTPVGAVPSGRSGPGIPVNVRAERDGQDFTATGRGRPIWPILLAIGVPAAGLVVMAGSVWWKTRLAAGSQPNK